MRRKKKEKVKKKNIIILIVLIIGLVLGGYYGYRYEQKNRLTVELKKNLDVEINKEMKIKELVKKIKNGTLVNGDDVIETSKLGKVDLKVIIKNKKNKKEEYPATIKVVDTIEPVIEVTNNEITCYVGKEVNLLEGVTVSDNSLEKLEVVVNGEYDFNSEGTYDLEYVAIDSSKNKGVHKFTLNVVGDPNNRTFKTSKGFNGKVVDGVTYIDGVLIANKTYSLPSNYGNGVTSETQNAFNKMRDDASNLGLNLWLSSGYRSYYDQQYIYNNYVSRDGQANADTYSARAGHSEHQTGLAFDLNTIDDSFSYTEEGKWVYDNCYNYGLILRYPKGKEEITGYMYESWHMRYVGEELAKKLYNNGDWITLEEYFGIDSKYN